jgi:thiosulfate/3-mercaptopyruvate sulfurtransferase
VPVLIEVEELATALEGAAPLIVGDVRWTLGGPPGSEEFEAGHIPGAQWVDLEHELSAPASGPGGRHPLPSVEVFEQAMRRIGISSDSAVVVCDSANALAASRLWWMLTDAGHTQVRVLNGGVAAWRSAGRPLETGAARPAAPGDFVAALGHRRLVVADEVAVALARDDPAVVVDVRAPERYSGATEPIDPVAGHIPGAVNLPSMAHVDGSGRFLPPTDLAARFASVGVDGSSIVYCGSGITAAHTVLALAHAGVEDAGLYAGSWSDWISDPARPVAGGQEPSRQEP